MFEAWGVRSLRLWLRIRRPLGQAKGALTYVLPSRKSRSGVNPRKGSRTTPNSKGPLNLRDGSPKSMRLNLLYSATSDCLKIASSLILANASLAYSRY